MARSPFQGTWQQGVRPTVVTAPDALVYINGETELIGCPSCKRRFDLHKYINSIQVDLSIDSVPGSANISLAIPRHAIDEFYFDGVPVICPMMEVEIYAKGHFLVEGVPQYYPIFWGLVTEVTDGYSGGAHTMSINCSDILKWWELCKMNTNPAWTGTKDNQMAWNLFGNVFTGMNPYDVIWSLSQEAMGDVVVGSGSLTSYNGEGVQPQTFSTALSDIMLYWQDRFTRIRSNLLLYGVQGVAVRGDTLWQEYKTAKREKGQPLASTAVQKANGGKYGGGVVFDVTSDAVKAFKTQFNNAGQVNFWQSEYQTKLELANACKEAIGFEFYMDVTGDIVFKPPFYNLDTLPNKPVSWIQDIDIIDWDFSESEAEVVTQVQMAGSYGGNIDYGFPADVEPMTSVTDYHLLRKYGWRTHQVNSEFLGDPVLMFYHGLDIMDRLNSRRHRGSVSIPLRPELRLGFPIYVAPKDQMWYVSGISHSIQFGGQAQTTLTLTARRSKFFAPRGIGKLTLTGFDKAGIISNAKKQDPKADGSKIAADISAQQTTTNSYKYTARQLSEGGTFEIRVGEAAQIPAPNPDVFSKPQEENPYAPLILRHPKSGRACGYPNVVMAYTRPLATTDVVTPGSKKRQTKATKPDVRKKMEESLGKLTDDISNTIKATDKNAIRLKYMQNRYMYGLNSTGVFTYLYDAGGMGTDHAISEMVFLRADRIKPPKPIGDEKSVKTFMSKSDGRHSALIRPVSDDRGFEHVGHFRYGRGISLRDGQLVLSNGSNEKAQVDLQLALSGDLSAALAAQSQGLTTLTTAYPNPSATLANLQPEDMQTGAIIDPNIVGTAKAVGTQEGQFVNTNEQFVKTSPLGAATNNLLQSVEAAQLSRALTLAEMGVKYQDGSDEPCDCLLGRADLAFISQGLKVTDTLTSTTPTETNIGNDPTKIDTSKAVAPSKAFPVGSPEDIAKKVNNFMFQLYGALDAPHQTFERAIRGANTPVENVTDMLMGPPSPQVGGTFSPPFNPANRFMVGDANSLAAQLVSSAAGLEQAWSTFTDDLKRKPAIQALEARSSELAQRLAELEAELASLNPNVAGYAERKAYLEGEIARLKEQKAKVDLLLQQIASGGPVPDNVFALIEGWLEEDAAAVATAAEQIGNEFVYSESVTLRNLGLALGTVEQPVPAITLADLLAASGVKV